jgi:hypothetical protein
VRVRYRDDHNLWSAWSAYSDFTTAANTAPATPSIAAPVNNATGVSRNPTIVASAFSDPDTDAHASSDWEIFSDSAGTMRVASALTETTYLASIAVTTANFTFEGALSGESSLARSVLYWVGVTYRDQYGAVSARSTLNRFQTSDNSPPNTPMVYAVFDTTGDPTRRPWITASGFSDPDALDTHASSLWEVFSGASLASRVAWSLDAAVDKTAVDFSTDAVTYEGGLVGKSALLPNTNYWVIVTYVDDKGGVATSASRQFMTLGNAAPAEVNVATVTSSRTPTATAGAYYDDEDDAHLLSDWEVREGTLATGALVATSSDDQTNLTSIAVSGATMTFRGSLAGLDSLAPAAWYNVRVRYRDEFGDAVAWDSVAVKTFQTPANQVPVTPAIVSPAADRVGVSRSPTVSGSAFSDPDFDLHQSTDWEIYADDGSGSGAAGAPAALVATSMADASHKTIVDVDPAMFAFTGALAGKTSLEPGTWYWVRVTYRDSRGGTSANSSASAFETGLNEAPEIPYISSPAGGAVDVELEPALAGSTYFDPDFDAHASTDWELFADAEGLTRLASRLADATNLTGIAFDLLTPEGVLVGQTHLAPSTTYYARVTYRDVHSAETQGAIQAFTTGAYPTTDTWPFYGSGCRPGAPSTGVMLAFVALCALAYAIARPRHSS